MSLSFAHSLLPAITSSLSPESFEGFGTMELVQSSLESFEERCSVYSIVGSSVLRYGTIPATSIPQTRVTKLKPSAKTRAQTMNMNRKPRGDSNTAIERVSESYFLIFDLPIAVPFL